MLNFRDLLDKWERARAASRPRDVSLNFEELATATFLERAHIPEQERAELISLLQRYFELAAETGEAYEPARAKFNALFDSLRPHAA